MSSALDNLNNTIGEMLIALIGLRAAVKNIANNQTHATFVSHVSVSLNDISAEMEISLCIISEYFDTFQLLPIWFTKWVSNTHLYRCIMYVQSSIMSVVQCIYRTCTKRKQTAESSGMHRYSSTVGDRFASSKHSKQVQQVCNVPRSVELIERAVSRRHDHHHHHHHHHTMSSSSQQDVNEGEDEVFQKKDGSINTNPSHSSGSPGSSSGAEQYSPTKEERVRDKYATYRFSGDRDTSIFDIDPDSDEGDGLEDMHRTDVESGLDANSMTDNSNNDRGDVVAAASSQQRPVSNSDTSSPSANKTLRSRTVQCINVRMRNEFLRSSSVLFRARAALLHNYNDVRRTYIFEASTTTQNSSNIVDGSALDRQHIMLSGEREMNDLLRKYEQQQQQQQEDNANNSEEYHLLQRTVLAEKKRLQSVKLSVREENSRLSLRNLNPRGAYIHRLSVIVELVVSLQSAFELNGSYWSPVACLWGCYTRVYDYVMECASSVYVEVTSMAAIAMQYNHTCYERVTQLKALSWSWVTGCSQCVKIASAIVITANFVLFDTVHELAISGLWSVIVIALIRQDNTSSSFLTGYQRIEGTVIGAVYSFGTFRIFKCELSTCKESTVIAILIAWIAFCALFREGTRHGYAATVASFTPIVLFLGNSAGIQGAWRRIQQTFIGVAIYLIIDNLVLPVRTYNIVKTSVLQCVTSTRIMFGETVAAIDQLVALERIAVVTVDSSGGGGGVTAAAAAAEDPNNSEEGFRSRRYTTEASSRSLQQQHRQKQQEKQSMSISQFKYNRPRAISNVSARSQSIVGGGESDAATRLRNGSTSAVNSGKNPSTAGVDAGDTQLGSDNVHTVLNHTPFIDVQSALHDENDNSEETKYDNTNYDVEGGNGGGEADAGTDDINGVIEVQNQQPSSTSLHAECVQPTAHLTLNDVFEHCELHLDNAKVQLTLMNEHLVRQGNQIQLVVHEPELWHKTFPTMAYENLLHHFRRVHKSGRAVNTGCRELSVIIVQMLERKEDVSCHLSLLGYMAEHLFLIASRAETALTLTHDALKRLYEKHEFEADLSPIVTLSRFCDKLLAAVDEHFRLVYIDQPATQLGVLNPYFIVAWVNLFEGMCGLIQHLSELGMALHSIRNVEALTAI